MRELRPYQTMKTGSHPATLSSLPTWNLRTREAAGSRSPSSALPLRSVMLSMGLIV